MKIVKKINNNVAIGIDNNRHEVVVFGRGVGFPDIPYELKDLSKIDRTYYDIDRKYFWLLQEIPEEVFLVVTGLLDFAKEKIPENLNPNLPFILADHVQFALERYRKDMNVSLPYSYELEYGYPELTRISRWFVENINKRFRVHLAKGEITSITMHFLNAMEGQKRDKTKKSSTARISRVIQRTTEIVEDFFELKIDKKSFHYFRYKNHIKFFIQRKEMGEEFNDRNEELYQSMTEQHPDIYQCVMKIDDYLLEEFGERCPHEELLYLMIHVNQLHSKEDCNQQGITST